MQASINTKGDGDDTMDIHAVDTGVSMGNASIATSAIAPTINMANKRATMILIKRISTTNSQYLNM
jgi:hypothetical protein